MDYKKTLNLPATAFPMKANLAQREPEQLKKWEEDQLYQNIRERSKDNKRFIVHLLGIGTGHSDAYDKV